MTFVPILLAMGHSGEHKHPLRCAECGGLGVWEKELDTDGRSFVGGHSCDACRGRGYHVCDICDEPAIAEIPDDLPGRATRVCERCLTVDEQDSSPGLSEARARLAARKGAA